jgi:hypothetical protein
MPVLGRQPSRQFGITLPASIQCFEAGSIEYLLIGINLVFGGKPHGFTELSKIR